MISDFLLIHYYAFYGLVDKYDFLYQKFLIWDKNNEFDTEGFYVSVLMTEQFSFMTLCIEHGCLHYYDFSEYIYNSGIKFPDSVFQAISNRFVMSNVFNELLFNKFSPCRIWYPDCPSEEMLNLLEKKGFYYPVLFTKMVHNLVNIKNLPETDDYYCEKIKKYFLNSNKYNDRFLSVIFNPEREIISKNAVQTKTVLDGFLKFRFLYKCTHGNARSCNPNNERGFYIDKDFDYLGLVDEGNDYPEVFFSYLQFELKYLYKTLNNNNFILENKEKENIKIEKILKDTYYATLVYNTTDEYNYYCLTKFAQVGYTSIEDIIKYSIFDFRTEYLIAVEYYDYLIENLPEKFKYNIGVAAIPSDTFSSFYFRHNFEPEVEIMKIAVKTNNTKIINDQFQKAVLNGYFYEYLDMKNKKWNNPPNKKYIKEFFDCI